MPECGTFGISAIQLDKLHRELRRSNPQFELPSNLNPTAADRDLQHLLRIQHAMVEYFVMHTMFRREVKHMS